MALIYPAFPRTGVSGSASRAHSRKSDCSSSFRCSRTSLRVSTSTTTSRPGNISFTVRHSGAIVRAADGLELAYGELAVCRNISIEINAGEIVALIGANGAGKSTTLRAIAGLLTPRAGAIRFRGADITRLPSHERALLGIALVPEGRHVFPFLTVRENLELGGFKNRRDGAK